MSASPVITKPRLRTLGEQAAEILRDSILRGDLQPGQKLVERELAATMGVSQSSIRDALRDLEHEGLVSKKTNTATHVTQLSREQVTEIVQVRTELEPIAFLLARRRMTAGQLKELQNLVDDISTGVSGNDYYWLSQSDFRFHRRIWQLSGNSTLERMLTQLCTPLFAYLMIFLSVTQSDLTQRVKSHQLLVDLLQKGGESEIREAVSEHVRNAWFEFLD